MRRNAQRAVEFGVAVQTVGASGVGRNCLGYGARDGLSRDRRTPQRGGFDRRRSEVHEVERLFVRGLSTRPETYNRREGENGAGV